MAPVPSSGVHRGYRTRFRTLAFMHGEHAVPAGVLENGGDIALKVLCAWTLFCRWGPVLRRRRSASLRRKGNVRHRSRRSPTVPIGRTHAVMSLAFFAILLQLATIYYFNAVNKRGWTWHRGSAVYYCLYQERMVTWFAVLVREHVGMRLSRILTYGTLGMEYAAPVLLLTPYGWQSSRRVAVILLPLMHLGFAAFSTRPVLVQPDRFLPLLLSAGLGRDRPVARATREVRQVHVREASPFAFALARRSVAPRYVRAAAFRPSSATPGGLLK